MPKSLLQLERLSSPSLFWLVVAPLRMANAGFLNHNNGMDSESFRASRWTSGNHLFPAVIMVTDLAVVRHKRSWFSKDEISFNISKVASVHIKTGLIPLSLSPPL